MWDVFIIIALLLADEPVVPRGEAVTMVWVKAQAPFELKEFIHSFVA